MEVSYHLRYKDYLDYYLLVHANRKYTIYQTWILRSVLGGSLFALGAHSFYNHPGLNQSIGLMIGGIAIFFLFPWLMRFDASRDIGRVVKEKYSPVFNVDWHATFSSDRITFTSGESRTDVMINEIKSIKEMARIFVFELPDEKIFIIPKDGIVDLAKFMDWLTVTRLTK